MRCTDELISTEEIEGFTVRFFVQPEEENPRGQFMNEDGSDDEETLSKIASGAYEWFMVRCTASKAGIDLGTDYLGGCCYESFADFLTPDGYAADMRRAAVDEAKATLAKLVA